jgi:hypothetical protein
LEELSRRERVHVDDALELGLIGVVRMADRRGARADRAAPQRRDGGGEALGHVRQAVAVAGGLSREHDRAARGEHALELHERALQVGDVVEHGVAEHEVEAVVRERQALGVGRFGLDVEPEALGVGGERLQHSGRDVAAGRFADQPGAHQVEREVARPRADLQRASEVAGLAAERLAHLRGDLAEAEIAEVDAPLGVVVVRRDIVVARVGVSDLLGAESGRHGAAPYTRAPCPRLPPGLELFNTRASL